MNLLYIRKHFSGNYLFLLLFFHSLVFFSANTKGPAQPSPDPQAWMKKQPVEFLENKGQLRDVNGNPAPYLLFKAEAPGLDLYITEKGLSYVFYRIDEDEDKEEHERLAMGAFSREKQVEKKQEVAFERIDMELSGAHISKANIVMEDTSIAYYNFLSSLGSVYHVKKYRRITIKQVYPGIDWVLYNSTGTGFKYDFIVHPGADPAQVELLYITKKRLQLDEKGNLLIKTGSDFLRENSPYSYVSASGEKVESAFKLISSIKRSGLYENRIAFDIKGHYHAMQTLVIDPQLVWATFYGGGAADGTECMTSDSQGNIYATGYQGGFNYPLLNGGGFFQATFSNGFILKFSNAGVLLWATYFVDASTLIRFHTIDSNDNLYLCGTTNSAGFPLVNNGGFFQPANGGSLSMDAFITKFNSAGTMIWSTFYGGNNNDDAVGIAADQNNNVFMVGTTLSTNFPLQNAGTYYEAAITGTASGFIVKFDATGNRLWASYLKGISEPALTVDQFGSIYVAGAVMGSLLVPLFNPGGGAYYQPTTGGGSMDACIMKFSNSGVLRWGTRYGGSLYEWVYSVIADKSGNTFMIGSTGSTNFPVQNSGTYYQATKAGQDDLFFLKFDSTGVRLWATYFGGTRADLLANNDHLALDDCGNLYFGCATQSRNIPLISPCEGGFFDTGLDTSAFAGPGGSDLYIGRFSNTGVHQWGTYFGGDGVDFRTSFDIDKSGNLFITGEWTNPTVAATYPAVSPSAASYTSPPIASDDHYFAKFTTAMPVLGSQTFSYTGPYCVSNTNTYLPATGPGFQAGGSYTAGAGLSINPLTGQITPSTSTPGSYTVSYKVIPCQCQGSQGIVAGTSTVMISAAPVLSVSGNYSICAGQTVTYTASGASNFTWTPGPTGPSLNVTAPANPVLLTYTLTGQNPGGCSAVKTLSVQVSRCTALDELAKQNFGVKIYPNPNKGEFTIDSESDLSLILVNEAGQMIREIELTAGNKRRITIHGLAGGIYFISDKQNAAGKSIKLVVEE